MPGDHIDRTFASTVPCEARRRIFGDARADIDDVARLLLQEVRHDDVGSMVDAFDIDIEDS